MRNICGINNCLSRLASICDTITGIRYLITNQYEYSKDILPAQLQILISYGTVYLSDIFILKLKEKSFMLYPVIVFNSLGIEIAHSNEISIFILYSCYTII